MDSVTILLISLFVLVLLAIVLIILFRTNPANHILLQSKLNEINSEIDSVERTIRDEFRQNREETQRLAKENRDELKSSLKDFGDSFDKSVAAFNNLQREKFGAMQQQQEKLIAGTEKKLEEMRVTVDEKLQKTLNERLGQSFELVGKQLENVQKGLGEMQTLAQDVGGLKRVLSNVKMRGGIGEVQLSMLLEQILAPDQYEANVKTKAGSSDVVEFAIKLPGRDEQGSTVWLPVDAKFPRDVYENLQNAYDTGDPLLIDYKTMNCPIYL